MSRKRSKWKFSPPRKRRPAAVPEIPEAEAQEMPEIQAEPETSAAEVFLQEEISREELPQEEFTREEMPQAETLTEDTPVAEDTPMVEEVSGTEDTPAAEKISGTEEIPATEEVFEREETPAAEEVPEAEETPAAEEISGMEDTPEEEILPAPEELPDYYFDEEEAAIEAAIEGFGSRLSDPEEVPDESCFVEEGPVAADEADGDAPEAGFDPDDEFEEEPYDDPDSEAPLSLYERGSGGRKRKKKKNSGKNKKDKGDSDSRKTVQIGGVVVGDGGPKICVPVTGRSKEEIVAQAKEIAAAGPDLVEWRVDYLEEAGGKRDIIDILVSLRSVLKDIPLLFTYRTEGEGGLGRVGWSHYAELLEWAACRPEIDLIDVEAMGLDVDTEGLIHVIHGRGTPVIASVHYCGEMPGKKEFKEAVRFMKQSGGDILKIAVTPRNKQDVLDLMGWTLKQSKKAGRPLVTMAMGDLGKVSRVSGSLTGSALTFGSVGEASAAGQIPAEELRRILDQM